MDIRGKRRAFRPVDRTGRAEQAPELEVHVQHISATPLSRRTVSTRLRERLLRALLGPLRPIYRGSAKRLQPVTLRLRQALKFCAQTRIGKSLGKACKRIAKAANTVIGPIIHFINRWPLWLKRSVSAFIVICLLAGGYIYIHNQQYKLSTAEQKLLALPSVDLKMVRETKDGFTYNHQQEQKVDGHSITTAAAPADSTGKFPYEVTLPHNESSGIKFSDSTGDLSFTMKPNFSTAAGREDKGRVIYPEGLNSVHAYTFKRNGVKEDIILSKAPGTDTYTKSWTLNLGDKLEAHMLPTGGVGIYSANSALFGNVQAGDPKDQALIDKARKNGQKTNLAFVIPAPYVTDTTSQKDYRNVKFALKNNTLTLTVQGMKSRAYPLSIDPTLVVTTTADFQQGTDDDGMIDYTTSGQIGRSGISYGAASAMTQQTSMIPGGRWAMGSFVYNGYIYIVGGQTTSADQNDVVYCPLNTDGSVGTCIDQTNAFTTEREFLKANVYNGYLYLMGGQSDISASGCTATGNMCNDIQYCPINSNGSVGTCTQILNAFATARRDFSSVVYNGYLYIIGGYLTSSSPLNDILHCPLNADGSVGTCTQQTSAFTTARYGHTSVIYNGYIYIIGGKGAASAAGCDGSGNCNDIQYCPLNSNGSVGTCTQQTSAFTGVRYYHSSVVYNGYLYIISGESFNGASFIYPNDIQYCPLNSNGSVGSCTQQLNPYINTNRIIFGAAVYNGFLYIIGGDTANGTQSDIQYGLLGSLGSAQKSTQQTSAFTSGRWGHTSVVYNGYLYIVGGYDWTNLYNDIQYCPLNTNGSVGTCTQQTSAFTTARFGHTSVVYSGYLYIIGGCTAVVSGLNCSGQLNDIQYCPLNSNGSVGTCTQQTSAFTTPRGYHSSVVNNGYLYIIGGQDTISSDVNDIQYCPLNTNGSVSACTQQTNAFTSARAMHNSVVYNGYLYIIGGLINTSVRSNDIQYCPLNTNGSVGTCTQQTNAFTYTRYGQTSVVYNGYLYISGGTITSSSLPDTNECPLNSNGSIGTCVRHGNAFTTVRYLHASVIYNGFIYIIGGTNGSGGDSDIQYMQITGGQLGLAGSTTQQTNAIIARQGAPTYVYNGYLYVVTGYGAGTGCSSSYCNDVQYCPLASDGSVGSCTDQTGVSHNTRYQSAGAIYNGYLYMVGGYSPSCASSVCSDIDYCPINSNGSVGTCTQQTSAFTSGRYGHATAVYNGYLYIIGGATPSVANDIQYCPLNANGSVGTCTQQTNAFTTARTQLSAVTYNGYIYIIGGETPPSNATNDIQYCPINANGSVGTCTQQVNAFDIPRFGQGSFMQNGSIYIVGGYNTSNGYLSDILKCSLKSNGSVDTCSQQQSILSSGRQIAGVTYANGYVYVAGGAGAANSSGCDASGYCNDVQHIKIIDRGFGGVGTATQQTGMLTTARQAMGTAVYNGYLYISGGTAGTTGKSDILHCPLNTDGSVGSCTQQSNALNTGRFRHGVVAYNGYLYNVGGVNSGTSPLNDIEYCPINSNGSVGACTDQTSAISSRQGVSSFAYNGYLYIVGGYDGFAYQNDIQYCPLNSNGSVGACTDQTSAFTTGRYWHNAIVYNGYVYILGGFTNSGGSTNLSDIQSCPLNSNGSIGTCAAVGSFAGARAAFGASVYNGYLYIAGGGSNAHAAGCDANNFCNDVQICPLTQSGGVGTCTQVTNAFTTTRQGDAAVANNGFLYVIGGLATASSYQSDIQRINIAGPAWKSKYERVLDIGSMATSASSIMFNGTVMCVANISYAAAGNNGIYGSTTTIYGALAGTSYLINVTNTRYVLISVTMDDSTCGGASNVTDVTLTYLFNPSAPTLIAPTNNASGVISSPVFQMKSSDPNNDYIKYKIEICSNSDCSSILRTVDQTSSQAGWSGQDANGGTAYVGNSNLASSTTATYALQAPPLNDATQYWWRAYAIDPGGDNVWSSASAIQTFTTASPMSVIGGSVNLGGGTHFGN